MPDMLELARDVATLRRTGAGWREQWRQLEAAFKAEHGDLLQTIEDLRLKRECAEFDLRSAAVEVFEITGSKSPGPGVTIKLFPALHYDEAEALDWAKEHGLALKLDTKAFEKMALVTTPTFVTITVDPKAYLAADMDKAVKEAINATP